MEAFASYLIKSTVWLTGFALVYLLFLRNERFFVLNRIYLVSGMIVSIVFPFFTWHYTVMMPSAPSIEVSELQMVGTADISEPFPTQTLLLYIYLAGALYLLYRVTRQTMSVLRVIRKSEILPYRSAKLIRTTEYPASFSFFSFVFVNPSTSDTETNEIVNHEMEHIRQQHWIDLLLFECLCTLQWYNPMSWLYGRFIRQNHEYLADERALQRTTNPAIYRAALLNQMFGGPVITLSNSFNYSINKKRFNMMKQTIYSPIRKLKLLLVLPLMAVVFYAFATPEYKYVNGDEDQKPNYTITQNKIEIPFTNQLTKADLEAIKADLAKADMNVDYSNLKFTSEGKLEAISANITFKDGTGNSFTATELSSSNYPIFKKDLNGGFGVNFSGVIMGKVLKPGGSPLQGATVVIAGTTVGTVTSSDGQFQLKDVPKDAELVVTFMGYEIVKVKPEAGKPVNITMNPLIIDMEEVTVTALASTPDTKNLDGPLGSSIKLQTNSPLKFGNADGSSAQPLIVIDGVITDNTNVNNIPPETIESINVLKDASATAAYGEKGKNGVILITKKKGNSTSQKSLIDINIQHAANANKDVYTIVEEMPQYPGGALALRKYLAYNIKYPRSAAEKGIQGKEFVSFVITKTGSVADARIISGVDPSLDQEALRIVQSMPSWQPGKQRGKEVDVQYTLPINFVLERNTEVKGEQDSKPYTVVEQMPEFPGRTEALKAFVTANLKYPAIALNNGIQGKVFVSFLVSKSGKVTNTKILRSVDPSIDQEALRVVESMPTWIPGKQNGEAVDVSYTLPIEFKLPEELRKSNNKAIGTATSYEQAPEFPGGKEALKSFIATSLKYPEIALANGIQGQVFVDFVVDKTGRISSAKVTRGVETALDREALRIVNSMPKWIPANQNGENVSAETNLPINFELPADYNPVDANMKKEKLRVPYQPKIMTKEQVAQIHELIIVPNPTNDKAMITLKDTDSMSKLEIGIFDSNGKLISKETKNGPSFTLSVAKLTTGTYLVVANDGKVQYQGHLIVNH